MQLFMCFCLLILHFNWLNHDGTVLFLLAIKFILQLIQIVIKAAGQLQLSLHDGCYELPIGEFPTVDLVETQGHVAI